MNNFLENFKSELLDQERCRKFFLEWLFNGQDVQCPRCGFPLQGARRPRFFKGEISYCSGCGKKYYPLRGSLFHWSKLNYVELVLILVLSELGVDSGQIAALLKRQPVAIKTAIKKIKEIKQSQAHTIIPANPRKPIVGQI